MIDPVTDTKRLIRQAFGRAAPSYDAAAHLQREIGSRLLERLDFMTLAPSRVLDLGCGTGVATRALQARYAKAAIIGLDAALAMLGQLHAADGGPPSRWWRWPGSGSGARIQAVCADAEKLPVASASVDLVFSNLALQWCNHEAVFSETLRVVRPGGLLLFSTFGPDTLKELRAAYASLDGAAHVNQFVDMHDLGDSLVQSGWADPVMDMEVVTVTYPGPSALVRELKDLGATTVKAGHASTGLRGRAYWAALEAAYPRVNDAKGNTRAPATFEVIYGHAWRPQASPRRDGKQVVQFHSRTTR